MFEYDVEADLIVLKKCRGLVALRVDGKWLCNPSMNLGKGCKVVIWTTFCDHIDLAFRAGDIVSSILNEAMMGRE